MLGVSTISAATKKEKRTEKETGREKQVVRKEYHREVRSVIIVFHKLKRT